MGIERAMLHIFLKRLLKKHNGKIWVESEKGHGSIFYFTLTRKLYSYFFYCMFLSVI